MILHNKSEEDKNGDCWLHNS